MGSGILALHYTGMAAAQFEVNSNNIAQYGMDSSSLTFWVAVFTFGILGVTLLIAADAADKANTRKSIR